MCKYTLVPYLASYKLQVPTPKKQVWTFLGLTGYYRRFIFNCIAAPLTNLIRWAVLESVSVGIKGSKSFGILKKTLLSSAVLKTPDFNKCFIVQTDTSEVGVGAVKSQQGTGVCDRPASF